MKFLSVLKTWLLVLIMVAMTSGAASAKVASGGINLAADVHQGLESSKSLNALGIDEVSTMFALDSPLATNGADGPFSKVKFEKPKTKRNGRPEIKTDVTREDAIKTLKSNGFSSKDFKAQNGGVGTVLTKGNKKITTFPSSTSTGGPTGKVQVNGQRKSSIRFKK